MVGNDWENSLNAPNSSKCLPKCPLQTHRCPNGLVLGGRATYVNLFCLILFLMYASKMIIIKPITSKILRSHRVQTISIQILFSL